jgi:hypothetical protein
MTQDLKDACSKGKLNQFFNSADNASALGRHNMVLNTMIADFTVRLELSYLVPLVDFIFNSL